MFTMGNKGPDKRHMLETQKPKRKAEFHYKLTYVVSDKISGQFLSLRVTITFSKSLLQHIHKMGSYTYI